MLDIFVGIASQLQRCNLLEQLFSNIALEVDDKGRDEFVVSVNTKNNILPTYITFFPNFFGMDIMSLYVCVYIYIYIY